MNDILTVRDVAQLLRTSQTFVYAHRRELGGVKVAGVLRFTRAAVMERMKPLFPARLPIEISKKALVTRSLAEAREQIRRER